MASEPKPKGPSLLQRLDAAQEARLARKERRVRNMRVKNDKRDLKQKRRAGEDRPPKLVAYPSPFAGQALEIEERIKAYESEVNRVVTNPAEVIRDNAYTIPWTRMMRPGDQNEAMIASASAGEQKRRLYQADLMTRKGLADAAMYRAQRERAFPQKMIEELARLGKEMLDARQVHEDANEKYAKEIATVRFWQDVIHTQCHMYFVRVSASAADVPDEDKREFDLVQFSLPPAIDADYEMKEAFYAALTNFTRQQFIDHLIEVDNSSFYDGVRDLAVRRYQQQVTAILDRDANADLDRVGPDIQQIEREARLDFETQLRDRVLDSSIHHARFLSGYREGGVVVAAYQGPTFAGPQRKLFAEPPARTPSVQMGATGAAKTLLQSSMVASALGAQAYFNPRPGEARKLTEQQFRLRGDVSYLDLNDTSPGQQFDTYGGQAGMVRGHMAPPQKVGIDLFGAPLQDFCTEKGYTLGLEGAKRLMAAIEYAVGGKDAGNVATWRKMVEAQLAPWFNLFAMEGLRQTELGQFGQAYAVETRPYDYSSGEVAPEDRHRVVFVTHEYKPVNEHGAPLKEPMYNRDGALVAQGEDVCRDANGKVLMDWVEVRTLKPGTGEEFGTPPEYLPYAVREIVPGPDGNPVVKRNPDGEPLMVRQLAQGHDAATLLKWGLEWWAASPSPEAYEWVASMQDATRELVKQWDLKQAAELNLDYEAVIGEFSRVRRNAAAKYIDENPIDSLQEQVEKDFEFALESLVPEARQKALADFRDHLVDLAENQGLEANAYAAAFDEPWVRERPLDEHGEPQPSLWDRADLRLKKTVATQRARRAEIEAEGGTWDPARDGKFAAASISPENPPDVVRAQFIAEVLADDAESDLRRRFDAAKQDALDKFVTDQKHKAVKAGVLAEREARKARGFEFPEGTKRSPEWDLLANYDLSARSPDAIADIMLLVYTHIEWVSSAWAQSGNRSLYSGKSFSEVIPDFATTLSRCYRDIEATREALSQESSGNGAGGFYITLNELKSSLLTRMAPLSAPADRAVNMEQIAKRVATLVIDATTDEDDARVNYVTQMLVTQAQELAKRDGDRVNELRQNIAEPSYLDYLNLGLSIGVPTDWLGAPVANRSDAVYHGMALRDPIMLGLYLAETASASKFGLKRIVRMAGETVNTFAAVQRPKDFEDSGGVPVEVSNTFNTAYMGPENHPYMLDILKDHAGVESTARPKFKRDKTVVDPGSQGLQTAWRQSWWGLGDRRPKENRRKQTVYLVEDPNARNREAARERLSRDHLVRVSPAGSICGPNGDSLAGDDAPAVLYSRQGRKLPPRLWYSSNSLPAPDDGNDADGLTRRGEYGMAQVGHLLACMAAPIPTARNSEFEADGRRFSLSFKGWRGAKVRGGILMFPKGEDGAREDYRPSADRHIPRVDEPMGTSGMRLPYDPALHISAHELHEWAQARAKTASILPLSSDHVITVADAWKARQIEERRALTEGLDGPRQVPQPQPVPVDDGVPLAAPPRGAVTPVRVPERGPARIHQRSKTQDGRQTGLDR